MKKNWRQRIAEATKNGGFTEEDRNDSSGWVTCACGEQDPRIPRWAINDEGCEAIGQPKDVDLRRLGNSFMIRVGEDNFGRALEILNMIELRSAEIIHGLKP